MLYDVIPGLALGSVHDNVTDGLATFATVRFVGARRRLFGAATIGSATRRGIAIPTVGDSTRRARFVREGKLGLCSAIHGLGTKCLSDTDACCSEPGRRACIVEREKPGDQLSRLRIRDRKGRGSRNIVAIAIPGRRRAVRRGLIHARVVCGHDDTIVGETIRKIDDNIAGRDGVRDDPHSGSRMLLNLEDVDRRNLSILR